MLRRWQIPQDLLVELNSATNLVGSSGLSEESVRHGFKPQVAFIPCRQLAIVAIRPDLVVHQNVHAAGVAVDVTLGTEVNDCSSHWVAPLWTP